MDFAFSHSTHPRTMSMKVTKGRSSTRVEIRDSISESAAFRTNQTLAFRTASTAERAKYIPGFVESIQRPRETQPAWHKWDLDSSLGAKH